MTPEQRERHFTILRETYGKIDKMDPSSPIYNELIEYLDRQETVLLKILAGAQIKWLSMLAHNRVLRRAMDIK